MTRTNLSLPLAALVLLSACGGEAPVQEEAPSLVIGQGEASSVTILHQMPTPNELFLQVRQIASKGDARWLSPAANADRFATLRSRAVNFGVYSTDLVYASTFGLNVEVARYYLASRKLAEALGLTALYSDAEFVRLETNLTRGDSLEVISNEVYLRSYERLQAEQMGGVLAMVMAGGWTESMYLMLSHGEGGQNDGLRQRVAEQKISLEHLIALCEAHAADTDVDAVATRLQEVLDLYDQVEVQRKAHTGRSSSGRMVLGDDLRMNMTPEKYEALKEAIVRLRADLIRPENAPNA